IFVNHSIYSQQNPQEGEYDDINQITIPACIEGEWVLTFSDEFNGNQLDLNVWEIKPYEQGAGSGEINTLDSDNLEISNGTLKIMINNQPKWRLFNKNHDTTYIENDGHQNFREFKYSTSEIWTKSADFRYGKYEIRARMDPFKGMWPAFWIYS